MLRFPDVLESWPWPRRVNPYFHEVKAESDAWIESFHCFDAQGMKVFNYCNTSKSLCHVVMCGKVLFPFYFQGLLAGMAYPVMSRGNEYPPCAFQVMTGFLRTSAYRLRFDADFLCV